MRNWPSFAWRCKGPRRQWQLIEDRVGFIDAKDYISVAPSALALRGRSLADIRFFICWRSSASSASARDFRREAVEQVSDLFERERKWATIWHVRKLCVVARLALGKAQSNSSSQHGEHLNPGRSLSRCGSRLRCVGLGPHQNFGPHTKFTHPHPQKLCTDCSVRLHCGMNCELRGYFICRCS